MTRDLPSAGLKSDFYNSGTGTEIRGPEVLPNSMLNPDSTLSTLNSRFNIEHIEFQIQHWAHWIWNQFLNNQSCSMLIRVWSTNHYCTQHWIQVHCPTRACLFNIDILFLYSLKKIINTKHNMFLLRTCCSGLFYQTLGSGLFAMGWHTPSVSGVYTRTDDLLASWSCFGQ